MSQDKINAERTALKRRIDKLIAAEFSTLERADVVAVLNELAASYARVPPAASGHPVVIERGASDRKHETSGWSARIANDVVDPLVPTPTDEEVRMMAAVSIDASSPDHVASLLHQILQVGAVLVSLKPSPPLNASVALSLHFPNAHLSIETRGRVVHVSPRGTAIEVSALGKEDRATLMAMSQDLQECAARNALNDGDQNDTDFNETGATDHGAAAGGRSDRRPGGPDGDRIQAGDGKVGDTLPGVHAAVDASATGPVPARSDEDLRSFAPFAGRSAAGAAARTAQFATRRRVDLTDPDQSILSTAVRKDSASTREFYGPGLPWLKPTETTDPDRIEELAEERIIDILLQLSESGFTGILEYLSDGLERQLYFDAGYLVEIARRPRLAAEELGPMLQAADRITRRQLAMAAAHADEFDMTLERSLLELDVLNAERIRNAIAGRLTYLLREVCDLGSGAVRTYGSHALAAGFLPQPPLRVHVAVERIVYDRFVKRLGQLSSTERDALIRRELDTYPEIVAQDRDRFERAVTSEDHRRLVDRVVTGRKRLREVFTESSLSSAETFAVIYALHRMGLLRFDRSLHHTVVRERLRENVTVKFLSVHKASFFEVLNVHWSSYDEVIEKAYSELLVQFDPATVPAELEAEVHERVAEIRDRVEAAYGVLARRETRHAYRMRIMPEYKLAHAIPLFLKQSELAERRNHWIEARDAIRRVLEIEPAHADALRRLEHIEARIARKDSPAQTH